MGFLKYLIDNGIPFESKPLAISFEDIGIKTKFDCDVMLDMVDKEEPHTETINAILDYRNTL